MKKNKTFALIPCGGRGTRMLSLTDNNPKAMLPLKNKPIIGWHLDKLKSENINDVCIVVGYEKEKLVDYVNLFYSDMNIIFAVQDDLRGLADAVNIGISKIAKKHFINDCNLLIILGDTIIKDNFSEKLNSNNFVGYKEVDDYKRWCLLTETNNIIDKFIDKPDTDPITRKAVIGIYYFTNMILLKNSIEEIIKNNITIKNEFQLSSAMIIYKQREAIYSEEFKDWMDCGEIETFNKTRKNITRYFNQIEVTDYGTIIKTSENESKLRQEINWYLNIPNKLKVFVPQLIDYSIHEKSFYELEYINYTPLQELFIYNLPELTEWDKMFSVIFNMIKQFKNQSNKNNFNCHQHLTNVLVDKTNKRINELISTNDYWNKLYENEFIYINLKKYKNIKYILNDVIKQINNEIINNCAGFWQIIHGDLFFGNMLYDINTSSFKIIDPRGNFDLDGIYGDIRYDIAKLNHSISGKYDFIVNGLYYLHNKDNSFNYHIYSSDKCNDVEKLFKTYVEKDFNYKHIKLLTGLLFLSMIPLHKEKENNQKMFYITAVKMLNEALA